MSQILGSMNMIREKTVLVFFVGILFSIILFFSLFFFFYSNTRTVSSKNSPKKRTHKIFQVIESNPLRKDTQFGLAIIPQVHILKEEYISHSSLNGNQVIISNLGDKEYECTGTCFCDDFAEQEGRRSTASSLLSRGLFIVLSAFSVSIAAKIAEETFRKDCIDRFSTLCEENRVISEVSDCTVIEKLNQEPNENSDLLSVHEELIRKQGFSSLRAETTSSSPQTSSSVSEIVEVDEDTDHSVEKYLCSGRCVMNPEAIEKSGMGVNEVLDLLGKRIGIQGCGTLEQSFEVKIFGERSVPEEFRKYRPQSQNTQELASLGEVRELEAKNIFLNQHMYDFCTWRGVEVEEDVTEEDVADDYSKNNFNFMGVPFCVEPGLDQIVCKKVGFLEPMDDEIQLMEEIHRHCKNNREDLLESEVCGCFYCMKMYPPDEIVEWVGKDAICAKCPVDSVVGGKSVKITMEILRKMHRYWFGGENLYKLLKKNPQS